MLPLFARLSQQQQDEVFAPHSARRIVLATNVAETSLTVPGIRFVIDAGTARIKRYSFRSKVEQLPIEPISQAAANQRAGRCGRVADGICIRLYDEADFLARPKFTDPEIVRSSLAGVILRMQSLNLGSVEDFPFLEAPPKRAIADGYQLLNELGATDDQNALTTIGRELARLPLDPRIGRMILEARNREALREVLVVASALSVQDVRDRPLEQQQAADQAHAKFDDDKSEFLGHAQALELARAFARRPRRASAVEPQARAAAARELHLAAPGARMARHPFPAAVGRHRARLARQRQRADLRAAAPVDARRPARQHRRQERRGRVVPRRARHPLLASSGRAPVEEAGRAGSSPPS